jgi:TolB-like protein
MTLFAELKRRNVARVGVAYAVIGWIIAQVAEFAFENFGAPEWVLKTFIVVLLLGLPLALFFAWAFEVTPEGVKREEDVDRSQSITHLTGRKLDFVIIAALVLGLGYFVWERQTSMRQVDSVEHADAAGADSASIAESSVRSIAVLPFINLSSDEEQAWFSDGLTEEILNALARTPDLLVAARTSSFRFRNSNDGIPTIAKALGVAHVLEGSVRRDRDRLRVTAQLIRASDGFQLWSQNYDRNPEDVISIQEEVAIEIATALETAMDPESLAKMVSSGTRSVEAYNAYLEGLTFRANAFNTGDVSAFLSAREAFERATGLDSTFALAYWRLAQFWRVQLQSTLILSGTVELPREEMLVLFDEAVENAIKNEQDPNSKTQYRAAQAGVHKRLTRALQLNTDYLQQRPNDQFAQFRQLTLLAILNRDDELRAAINEYQERDGYDVVVVNTSMTFSLIGNDKQFIREYANEALRRFTDSAFITYQAHRSLLWAGDIDGAAKLYEILQSSELADKSLQLVTLRQACAENRSADAARIYNVVNTRHAESPVIIWLANLIMNQNDKAIEALVPFDDDKNIGSLSDYLSYAYFVARPFPNLMAFVEIQGIELREPLEIPYRCKP